MTPQKEKMMNPNPMMNHRPSITLMLAQPRGFCAGVVRAIEIVEQALLKYGAPVFVRHEIVHNRTVVETLEQKGAIFIDRLDEILPKDVDRPVIFSAHGVPKTVPEYAKNHHLFALDATCPLVSKVHRAVEKHYNAGRHILLIGHQGHPEVIGTMGQIPASHIDLIETLEDVADFTPTQDQLENGLAYATQTTLSVADTANIIQALKHKFPDIHAPKQEDICYATTNRQQAMIKLAAQADVIMVIGAPNSSNSKRLVDVAKQAGCDRAFLIQQAAEIDWGWLAPHDAPLTVGLSAGASAPESLVAEVIAEFQARFALDIHTIDGPIETTHFKLPRILMDA